MLSLIVSNSLLNPGNTNIKPGLERMQLVLEKLDNPQNKYKVIHIAGTNGKGSTAAFITTGLIHAGFKTGKFMSPHILKINECITINNQEIDDENIERIYFLIAEVIQKYNMEQPSPFELLTLIMFYYMVEEKVEYLVLEAGMGGESDCTNVVESIYSIITNIGMEHTKWLGDTLQKIATNKAGIIKNGKTIIADNRIELLNAVREKTNNYVNVLEKYYFRVELDDENCHTDVFIKLKNHIFPNKSGIIATEYGITKPGVIKYLKLGLYGKFQAHNFLIAYELFKDLNLDNKSIEFAASNAFIPCRMQVMGRDPLIIYDITHNLSGAIVLCETLTNNNKYLHNLPNEIVFSNSIPLNQLNKNDIVFITAILGDKDIRKILELFSIITNNIIFTSIPNNPRALSAANLSNMANDLFKNKYIIDNCTEALQFAKSLQKKMIVVCGSSYIFQNLI